MKMTEEELEESLEMKKHVLDSLGVISYEHFLEFKENAWRGLVTLKNNDFLVNIGRALCLATDKDAVKIILSWREECSHCDLATRILRAREKAKGKI